MVDFCARPGARRAVPAGPLCEGLLTVCALRQRQRSPSTMSPGTPSHTSASARHADRRYILELMACLACRGAQTAIAHREEQPGRAVGGGWASRRRGACLRRSSTPSTTATAGAGHGRQRQVAWPRCLACRVARTQKGPDRLYALSRARSSMPARLHAVTHFNQPRRACVRQRDASTPADPAQTLRRVRITASAWLCASRA